MLPTAHNWIVHIKDVETGEHIIEPAVASMIQVTYEQDVQELVTNYGHTVRIAGARRGQLNIEFPMTNMDVYRGLLGDTPIRPMDVQINPANDDRNHNNYSRCFLRSMDFEINGDAMSFMKTQWVFINAEAHLHVPQELRVSPRQFSRRPEPVQKLDWRQLGF